MVSPAELRRSKRFLPRSEAFIAVRPGFSKLGKILDIGLGGIGFRHALTEETPDLPGLSRVDIFSSDSAFYLPSLSCRMIYDVPFQEDGSARHGLEHRRCGLKFDGLTDEQAEAVEHLLAHHAHPDE
jgi:hypothetical protein